MAERLNREVKKMSIRMVAVDMDGTFLDDNMQYDREHFARLYAKMKSQGCHFVVASGNQYYQLKSFFGEIDDEISYVAENGAFVMDAGKLLYAAELSEPDVQKVIQIVQSHPDLGCVMCGLEGAYVLDTVDEENYQFMRLYYHRLNRVAKLEDVQDQIFKFALATSPDTESIWEEVLRQELDGIMVPVTSGHQSIDLILPGCHKASGIQRLIKLWNLSPEECAAFGDGGNDLEMIKLCKYGYAMANATPKVLATAKYHTASNNENGVLTALDKLL
ncbi:Cof-type HAD-IIB family hydrolase [Oscillospiraceae bacterium PP1C4]